jgi:ubiquinone/menaquinone biosynthesis C-methylase UbiE
MHHMPSTFGKTAIIKTFFNEQWALYQKVMFNNYMCHREAYAALHTFLLNRKKPFEFVDLGCGDAVYSARALKDTGVRSYEAIDLADVALDEARKNMAPVPCPKAFQQGNFFDALKVRRALTDVIFIGYSLHHLLHDEKANFIRRCHELLRPEGAFLCLEPFTREKETRDQYLDRWWKYVRANWTSLTEREFELVHEHVFTSDHPESIETLRGMGKDAGFEKIEVLWRDPTEFYALLSFEA